MIGGEKRALCLDDRLVRSLSGELIGIVQSGKTGAAKLSGAPCMPRNSGASYRRTLASITGASPLAQEILRAESSRMISSGVISSRRERWVEVEALLV